MSFGRSSRLVIAMTFVGMVLGGCGETLKSHHVVETFRGSDKIHVFASDAEGARSAAKFAEKIDYSTRPPDPSHKDVAHKWQQARWKGVRLLKDPSFALEDKLDALIEDGTNAHHRLKVMLEQGFSRVAVEGKYVVALVDGPAGTSGWKATLCDDGPSFRKRSRQAFASHPRGAWTLRGGEKDIVIGVEKMPVGSIASNAATAYDATTLIFLASEEPRMSKASWRKLLATSSGARVWIKSDDGWEELGK